MARVEYGTQAGARGKMSVWKIVIITVAIFAGAVIATSLLMGYHLRSRALRAVVVCRLAEPPTSPAELAALIEQSVSALKDRAKILRKDFKVSRAEVTPGSDGAIRVSFSTLGDATEFAKQLMRYGMLELRLVEPYMAPPEGQNGEAPAGYEWLTFSTWQVQEKPAKLVFEQERLLIKRQPELSIRRVKEASYRRVMTRPPVFALEVQFNDDDSKAFAETTSRCLNQRLAAVMDGDVLTAPEVDAVIEGGKVRVVPFRDADEVGRIARVLSCGALPTHLSIESIETSGPVRRLKTDR